MSRPSRLAAVLYNVEATWADQSVSTFGTRLVPTNEVDVSKLTWTKFKPERVVQYRNEITPMCNGYLGGEIETEFAITGLGTSASGTITLNALMTLLGIVIGASMNWIWRGNAAGLGGFHLVFRFAPSDAALVGTANMFVGLGASYADVDPATLTNIVGIGCSSGDTVMQLYAAGAAAQAKTSLGANFPVNNPSTDVYELALYAAPNGTTISYRVERLNTGDVATGVISAAANLFSSTTFLRPVMGRSNGGTAAAVAFDFISAYFETDL